MNLGEKFSYLFDEKEGEIALKFTYPKDKASSKDTHLYFNLISPTNSMELIVDNIDGAIYRAVDGYIEYKKKEIMTDEFMITIKKINSWVNHFVHMTLIVTTSTTAVKLDTTMTHY